MFAVPIDHHLHSRDFSDGQLELRELIAKTRALGLQPAVSDHFPQGMRRSEDVVGYVERVRELGGQLGTSVLCGIELGLDEAGTEPLPADALAGLDYIVGGVHGLPAGRDRAERFAFDEYIRHWFALLYPSTNQAPAPKPVAAPDRLLDDVLELLDAAFSVHPVDILAHATRLPPLNFGEPEVAIPERWQLRLFEALNRHGVALEISGRGQLPHLEMLRRAVDSGVQLAVGSDGHSGPGPYDHPLRMLRELGPDVPLFSARTPKEARRSAAAWSRSLARA